VLITNDDGGGAPGLLALAQEIIAAYPQSVALASATECGHFGTSLRRDGWLRRPADLAVSAPGSPMAWQATPAMLVKAACEGIWGQPPDVVVVGVNYGPNVGRDVLHSGTVGTALTAINLGVRALALSLDDVFSTGGQEDGFMHWHTAATLAVPLIEWLADNPFPTALSVNVPNRPLSLVSGVRPARLASTGAASLCSDAPAGETDVALLTSGYITVSTVIALDGIPGDTAAAAGWLDQHLTPPERRVSSDMIAG
jgi:5'-nucleotidase